MKNLTAGYLLRRQNLLWYFNHFDFCIITNNNVIPFDPIKIKTEIKMVM